VADPGGACPPRVVGATKIFARHLHVLLTLILLYTIASTIVIYKKHFWSDYYILVILCLSAQCIYIREARAQYTVLSVSAVSADTCWLHFDRYSPVTLDRWDTPNGIQRVVAVLPLIAMCH